MIAEKMVTKNLTRKSNNEKIMEYLRIHPERIRTSDLADKTGIDIKNISRYLKQLESENEILRETIQEGKIRVVYVSLTTIKKNNTSRINKMQSKKNLKSKRKPETTHSNKNLKIEEKSNQEIELSTTRKRKLTEDQKIAFYIKTISSELITALNHAINTIKNKPEVKAKKKGATRYDHFKNWTEYREYFETLNKSIKNETKIKKNESET